MINVSFLLNVYLNISNKLILKNKITIQAHITEHMDV